MTIRVAINGYGRIGRNVLRALHESGKREQIQIVALNDLGDAQINAHLTRFDTVHGRFNGNVEAGDDCLIVNGDRIRTLSERDPARLPWKELGVDVVYECTGLFTERDPGRGPPGSGRAQGDHQRPRQRRRCHRGVRHQPS